MSKSSEDQAKRQLEAMTSRKAGFGYGYFANINSIYPYGVGVGISAGSVNVIVDAEDPNYPDIYDILPTHLRNSQ